MTLIFLNGGGMRGGPLHHQIHGAPLVRQAISAPKYRYYSVGDRFPAMYEVSEGGVAVHGELYDVPLEVLRDRLIPAEPPELELGVIELDDGTASLATVLRSTATPDLVDISDYGDWRAYQAMQRLNTATEAELAAELTDCLAVPSWVHGLLAGRPYPDSAAVLAAARTAADALSHDEVRAALESHPRIGEHATEPGRSAAWSHSEQSGVTTHADRLRAANERYERQFGHLYLVYAADKNAEQILANLESRLHNDPDTELDVARAELREIAALRLSRLLATPERTVRRDDDETRAWGGTVTTHVLDAVTGLPAEGLPVRLETGDGVWLGSGATDEDGRIREIGPAVVDSGTYRLRFDTDAYFTDHGRDSFYPEVVVTFRITGPTRGYHVPVLLSPFAYSTYRGS